MSNANAFRTCPTTGLRVNAAHTAAGALVAAAAVLVAGAWVRRRIAGDAHELLDTARRIGDGDLDTPPAPMATAELGALRDALRRMQLRLRTDRVTGLANRESVLTRLHDRMRPGRRGRPHNAPGLRPCSRRRGRGPAGRGTRSRGRGGRRKRGSRR